MSNTGKKKGEKKRVAFQIFSHYNLVVRYFVENALDAEYVKQPEMTRRTLDAGAKYSPDQVCSPFKLGLGSMIDALDAGANTIIMTFGICRLGYYGELQEQILRDLGYDFDFINLAEYSTGNMKDFLIALRRINPKVKLPRILKVAGEALRMMTVLDTAEEYYYENCGFEVEKGSMKKAWDDLLVSMSRVNSLHEINQVARESRRRFMEIEIDKPEHPIRIGVVGEYFTAVDGFSNLFLEQKLADMGVEVNRWMNVTNRNLKYKGKKFEKEIYDYCKYEMGPTSTANIWCAKYYATHGYDGIIHIKSAGCTPEIDIMPVLQNISKDYKIPILYLSYDTQNSDTGLDTRLEAFYDMLYLRKEAS